MVRSSSATRRSTAGAVLLALASCLPFTTGYARDLPVYAIGADSGYRDMLQHAGPRQVYLLGDATHGTREFYLFRQQVTRELVTDHGARHLVLEIGPDEAELLDQWLQGQSGNREPAATILEKSVKRWPRWVWANREVAGFLDWLRAYNLERSDENRVRLHGMDLQRLGTMESEIYAGLVDSDPYGAWNYRSNHMADRVTDILSSAEATVVWAHNNHVGDKRADDVRGTGLISLGQLLRDRIGIDNVFILGSAGYQGSFVAAPRWGEAHRVTSLPPAIDGSLAALLAQTDFDNPLLYWEDAGQREQWDLQLLHRGVGVVYQGGGNGANDPDTYVATRPGWRYDALVYWRDSGPVTPLGD